MAVVEDHYAPAPHHATLDALVQALQHVRPLQGLTGDDYRWLAEHGHEERRSVGERVFRQGERTDEMTILLEGEVEVRRRIGARTEIYAGRAGEITGVLPFSRMVSYGGDGVVVKDVWALTYPREMFDEMVRAIPGLGARVAAILLDRVREVTRIEQQAEKLVALNKLSGNLAHELNNPASAAQRSATQLLAELRRYGRAKFALGALCISKEKLAAVQEWEAGLATGAATADADSLAASDRESGVERWLGARGLQLDEEAVETLAELNVTSEHLDQLPADLSTLELSAFLNQFALSRRTERMTSAVLDSTHRIFSIIDAIKDYAYLDQAPLQQVNIEQALRNTLAMLHSRLSKVQVVETFAPNLPTVHAFGSELNQVWTALIENALDAIADEGRLELRAHCEADWMIVEIIDSGPGIPDDMKDRIFEPFFTTKAIGSGLGLGLDTVTRIVRKHRGVITVQHVEEGTCFQVRLPLEQWRAY